MPASEAVRLGRKRALSSCPNPLFLHWLSELRDQAKERGMKTQYVYQKAINSLNKYPLPLRNGKEAKILQNFGDGICKILDDRLQRHYKEHGADAPIHSLPGGVDPPRRRSNKLATSKPHSEISSDTSDRGHANSKNVPGGGGKEKGWKKKREYVPQKRTGGYAVLLVLYRHCQTVLSKATYKSISWSWTNTEHRFNKIPGSKGFMLKMELQREAQPLCDKSFTVPDLGSKYTAWSSVSTLIQKDLLVKTHSPARYSLTERGMALAERLEASEGGGTGERGPPAVDLTEEDEPEEWEDGEEGEDRSPAETPALPDAGLVVSGKSQAAETLSRPLGEPLLPGCYDIVLCVDFIETTGGCAASKQELVKELQRNGVTFDVRKLNVGDFLWVARERVAPVPGQLRPPQGKELVLDYVIERKRIDDLCGSIIDGRFREQKFRLKRCGLRRPIYLVEECGSAAAHLSLPESTLQQAIVNTQVVDGFFVKRVQDVKESVAYLTVMTRQLQKLYQNSTLFCRSREGEEEEEGEGGSEVPCAGRGRESHSCSLLSFSEFNHGAVKNKCQTVREVFARQLMQISGISGDKASAILEHYSTVSSLLQAYERCPSEAEREKLLSNIRYGKLKRNVGPALSRTVYQLYCTPGPLS